MMLEGKDSAEILVNKAPVALFVYRRADHTRESLEALIKCQGYSESNVFVFCDGAKGESDREDVKITRDVVRELLGSNATIIESEFNRGLANSIIEGVTKLCNEYGRVIVLEDDLVVSPIFLTYMNAALNKYEDVEEVMQVSGFIFPVTTFVNYKESLFLPFTTSWGWATWDRAWKSFDPFAKGWQEMLGDICLRNKFNIDGSFDYFSMLKKQQEGYIDSWAIRWYWSVFKKNGLVLYPPVSLVNNIGFDGSGTHGWRKAKELSGELTKFNCVFGFPNDVNVNKVNFYEIKKPLRKINGGFIDNMLRRILKFYRLGPVK